MDRETRQSDDDLTRSEYCAEEMHSFAAAEMSTLVDLEGESVADLLGERGSQPQIATQEDATEEIVVEQKVNLFTSTSTPVKLPVEVRRGPLSLKVALIVSPSKRAANVIITTAESVRGVLDCVRPKKSGRCHLWISSRTATSFEKVNTEIGLFEIGSMIGRCASGKNEPAVLSAGNVQIEMLLREELSGQEAHRKD